MIQFDLKLSGDITSALDKFEERVKQQALFSGVAKAAEVVYEEMRLNASRGGPSAPDVQSGKLVDSIYRAYVPERSGNDEKVYVVGPRQKDAFYWRFLEHGTSKMAAQPFIRPTISVLPRALKEGQERMRERLKEG